MKSCCEVRNQPAEASLDGEQNILAVERVKFGAPANGSLVGTAELVIPVAKVANLTEPTDSSAGSGPEDYSESEVKFDPNPIDNSLDVLAASMHGGAATQKDQWDSAMDDAWSRFMQAGLGLKKRFVVDDFIANGEPQDKGSMEWKQWYITTIVESQAARIFWVFLVVLNSILVGIEADSHDSAHDLFSFLEKMFLGLFILEVVLKIFGMGFKMFFADSWNTVDVLVIASSFIESILEFALGQGTNNLSIIRLVRVLRVVRLVGMFEKLATLLEAFLGAMKQVVWVAGLALIILYIFAVMAHGFFSENATLRANPDYQIGWFNTLPATMLTLFQLMTLDDWANIMRPVGDSLPAAWIFTIIFVMLGMAIMNLVVAIFIDNLLAQTDKLQAAKRKKARLKKEKNMAVVAQALLCFDIDHDGKLSPDELHALLNKLDGPDKRLSTVFNQLGISVELIFEQSELAILDNGEINVSELMKMVTAATDPLTKQDLYQLLQRMHEIEAKHTGEVERLEKKIDANHLEIMSALGMPRSSAPAEVNPALALVSVARPPDPNGSLSWF